MSNVKFGLVQEPLNSASALDYIYCALLDYDTMYSLVHVITKTKVINVYDLKKM
jgi:hypothetical protein